MKFQLNKQGYEKIKKRSPWLYANEVEEKECNPGTIADLYYKDKFVGTGFYNPLSKIRVRMLTFEDELIGKEFFKKRIKKAIEKRNFNNTNAYRLVHSEADFLPGLIVDKYGDNLVVSFTTAGMDNLKGIIIESLIELLNIKGIYEKADKIREKEGLEVISRTLYGEVDDEFIIEENNKKFLAYLKEGQKTGFFLDQRKNRKIVSNYAGKKTLDLFANAGGFGIYANSEFTKFVEISALACESINKNCELNNLKNYEIVKADVFKFLEKEKEKYDLIIVDPPAFAKTKSQRKGALRGWKYLIVNSLKILEENGYLALFSCSHSITQKDLLDLALSSSILENCSLEVVEFLYQDKDHPYILNIPNSLYLSGILLKKLV